MASHAIILQNPSIIPSSPHSSFFPVIPSRISFVSHFDSIIVNAYLPILRLEPNPGERREAESSPEDNDSINAKKKKKKKEGKKELRPNFYHQTLKKWSVKISSQRTKLPWQEQGPEEMERVFHCSPPAGMPVEPSTNPTGLAFFDGRAKSRTALLDLEIDSSDRVEKLPRSSYHARTRNSQRDFVERNSHTEANCIKLGIPLPLAPWAQRVESQRSSLKHVKLFLVRDTGLTDSSNDDEPSSSSRFVSSSIRRGGKLMMQESGAISLPKTRKKSQLNVDEVASTIPTQNPKYDAKFPKNRVTLINENLEESMDNHNPEDASSYVGSYHENIPTNSLFDSDTSADSLSFPWGNANGVSNVDLVRRRSNTDMAERTIPEPELRRLRNEALRMKERMTVGPAGITETVVENIHEKWKDVEVVKLHIEGPPSLNMKRTNEILEIKTGGIAIWRSGSSIVLYRGLNYKLPCARFFSRISDATSSMDDSEYANHSTITKAATKVLEQSDADVELSGARTFECSSDASHIDSILNELGPRYEDWSGRDPLPVDADLLPGIVPGYKPPFRLLPYKTKRSLTNRQMTFLRRIARSMAPHFALGRSKQLQGLANGMVKLWETSAIAKIAIKRGVQNTSNERMAEEIKELTGGTLLSRNKEYIVFYRGNDFLTPCIRDTLIEREKLATVQQDAEEEARCRASGLINSNPKAIKRVPYLAGTLTETLKACNHWANQPSSNDRDEMRRDLALSQQESVIRNLERKLSYAMAKVRNAEKTLAKVQETQRPADLPTDLETVTDEERSLFRKIGLKMRSYLPLGRRGVFDGTIQNIHLSWKHMELAKIIVKANKNLGQVKHIAISLEAESGGVLISVDETTKGYVIILYRGKNYQRPKALRPNNLLSKREALQRSIELQRRQALNYHIANLQEQIQMLKSQLRLKSSLTGKEAMKTDNEVVDAFSDNDPNLDT